MNTTRSNQIHSDTINKQEIQKILAISSPRNRAFFAMIAQTGLKPYTLIRLKIKDIEPDFSRREKTCLKGYSGK